MKGRLAQTRYIHPFGACDFGQDGFSCSDEGAADRRLEHPFFQQLRWKRRDGYTAFHKTKPMNRKKQKSRNRRKKELEWQQSGRHSVPGYRAGDRREWLAHRKEELIRLSEGRDKDEKENWDALDYNYADALLDDLMGNTSHASAAPTPKPRYLGHKHEKYYRIVSSQMERFNEAMKKMEEEDNEDQQKQLMDMATLPPDHDISMVVRAYRDRHGNRSKPIGLGKALEHVLRDLSLPTAAFGEETYNALLTCCRTPKEARRIFRLMTDRQHPISSYSWSILVDIHAKTGDFEGCDQVIQEMAREGVAPTLAAYTSLLAACHKVCNAGHIPPSVRAKAGRLGWNKWKEMRVVGIDPDVMAYGALLRICAARGKAERALNVLEEMRAMEVKPTTLCFTSALRAVSRSHQTAIRYENGWSKKNRQRERITAHHGALARQIVILAEEAEVEQDDGFVSALMLCAAAAGDSATAKAILLASEVRKMDHLRTIGSDSHLKQLQGQVHDLQETKPGLEGNDGLEGGSMLDANADGSLATKNDSAVATHKKERRPSFGEREYGKDTRVLSALMTACSQAIDRSLGTMWAGRDNKGYLCDNSLRRIKARPQPRYMDNSIPGVSNMDVALGAAKWDEEQPKLMSKRQRRRTKFAGIELDESVGSNLDDIDEYFYQTFKDEDPAQERFREIEEYKKQLASQGQETATQVEEIADETKHPLEGVSFYDAATGQWHETDEEPQVTATSIEEPTEEWFFDVDEGKWNVRPIERQAEVVYEEEFSAKESVSEEDVRSTDSDTNRNDNDDDTEYYFDNDDMRWKTRPKTIQPALTAYEAASMANKPQNSVVTMKSSSSSLPSNHRNNDDDVIVSASNVSQSASWLFLFMFFPAYFARYQWGPAATCGSVFLSQALHWIDAWVD